MPRRETMKSNIKTNFLTSGGTQKRPAFVIHRFFPANVDIITLQGISDSQSSVNSQDERVSLLGTFFFRKTFLYV